MDFCFGQHSNHHDTTLNLFNFNSLTSSSTLTPRGDCLTSMNSRSPSRWRAFNTPSCFSWILPPLETNDQLSLSGFQYERRIWWQCWATGIQRIKAPNLLAAAWFLKRPKKGFSRARIRVVVLLRSLCQHQLLLCVYDGISSRMKMKHQKDSSPLMIGFAALTLGWSASLRTTSYLNLFPAPEENHSPSQEFQGGEFWIQTE